MAIDKINQLLAQEYDLYLNQIRIIYSAETQKKISLPFFMHVSENYLKAEKRIMIVGQETQTWYGNLHDGQYDTKKIIERHKEFDMGKDRKSSPFWQFAIFLNKKINGDVPLNTFLWTNLSRFDYCGKKVPDEISKKNKLGFQLLRREVEITEPEIIVFTTYWARDKYIKLAFPDFEVESVPDFSCKFLGRLKAPELPKNSFRTYHPNYLNWQKPKNNIKGIINGLVNQLNT